MHNICKYKGEQHIQITNDSAIPITEIGTLRSSFNNVFASTDLSTNLIYVANWLIIIVKFTLIMMIVVRKSSVGESDSKGA
jgi:hypothetical protein